MDGARELVIPIVNLVAELSEEDEVVMPKFELSQESDEEVRSPARVQVVSVALSLAYSRDGVEVHCWPMLPGIAFPTSQDNASVSCVGGSSAPSFEFLVQQTMENSQRPPTRCGRCEHCYRALRPGASATASPVLVCSKWKRHERHTYRTLAMREADDMEFPRLMLRRARVLW